MTFLVTLLSSLLGVREPAAKLIISTFAGLLALGVLGGTYLWVKDKGADEVRAEIERQNHDNVVKGSRARLSRHQCIDAGGLWDFRHNVCK